MFHNSNIPLGRPRSFDERDPLERPSVEDKYRGKLVIVGAVGWPSKGGFNGAAVPGTPQQSASQGAGILSVIASM